VGLKQNILDANKKDKTDCDDDDDEVNIEEVKDDDKQNDETADATVDT